MTPTLAAARRSDAPQGLSYPFPDAPGPGAVRELAAGVYWLRMPLPFALDHINLWLLRDDSGWTIVDCGLNTDTTRQSWEQIFATCLDGLPVRRIIVTHCHPDHLGLGGWLTERFGVNVWMSAGEYFTAHALYNGVGGSSNDDAIQLFLRHGLKLDGQAALNQRGNSYRRGLTPPPQHYRRIMDGEVITVGKHAWRVMMGYGHAPEHAALYCEELDVLISGDMVLPKISTNISVWATEPDSDPLRLFLESLARYGAALPAQTLVLPSHGLPFHGLHWRISQLVAHHDERLSELLAACREPATAADVVPVLFRRKLDTHQLFFAMGEAVAHLNHLMYQGRVAREQSPDGLLRFQARV